MRAEFEHLPAPEARPLRPRVCAKSLVDRGLCQVDVAQPSLAPGLQQAVDARVITPHVALLHHKPLGLGKVQNGSERLHVQCRRLLEMQVFTGLYDAETVSSVVRHRSFHGNGIDRRVSQQRFGVADSNALVFVLGANRGIVVPQAGDFEVRRCANDPEFAGAVRVAGSQEPDANGLARRTGRRQRGRQASGEESAANHGSRFRHYRTCSPTGAQMIRGNESEPGPGRSGKRAWAIPRAGVGHGSTRNRACSSPAQAVAR